MSKELSLGQEISEQFIVGENKDGSPIIRPERYGSAGISAAELGALKRLYKKTREEEFNGKQILSDKEKNLLREKITESIVDKGWPGLENLELSDLADTAVKHACMVVENLYQVRGEESLPGLVWSYATKNQFDRFVEKVLSENGNLDKGTELSQEWSAPSARKELKGGIVNYPSEVDDRYVHGMGKATRYWPAQLMRYLESIRLGKATSEDLEKYKVGNTNLEKYKIPWETFEETIKSAEKIEDIAVGIAIKTLEVLKARGLSDEQLVATIANGYSPSGVITEHGKVSEIDLVWNKLLTKVQSNENLKSLYQKLKEEFKSIS